MKDQHALEHRMDKNQPVHFKEELGCSGVKLIFQG